jgi:exosortase C (VPDSG-CTERM-specific)
MYAARADTGARPDEMDSAGDYRRRLGRWAVSVAGLVVLFIKPLASLAVYAVESDLFSYILLIPFVSAYLLYILRHRLAGESYRKSIRGAVLFAGLGAAALVAGLLFRAGLSLNDHLALATLGFVAFVAATGFLCLGSTWMSAAAFPIGFLFFMAPLPDAVVDAIEKGSVLASAEAGAMYFNVIGTPLVRQGTIFELPGIVLQVAQECSGIRSSLVLFITSTLGSYLFLRDPWRRLALVSFVIPLGIMRNGFRVFVLGILSVYIGPHMLDTPLHHRGGPIFFALSLIPFFLFLWWLRRGEARADARL